MKNTVLNTRPKSPDKAEKKPPASRGSCYQVLRAAGVTVLEAARRLAPLRRFLGFFGGILNWPIQHNIRGSDISGDLESGTRSGPGAAAAANSATSPKKIPITPDLTNGEPFFGELLLKILMLRAYDRNLH